MLFNILGRMFGVEKLQSIHALRLRLAAPWAQEGPAWVLFACAALGVGAALFYLRCQTIKRKRVSICLAVARSALLVGLLLLLADPVLKAEFTNRPRPSLWVLFDGTESMDIRDELSSNERDALFAATGIRSQNAAAAQQNPSRMDYVRALVNRAGKENLFKRLQRDFRLQAFLLDRPDSVRELTLSHGPGEAIDTSLLAAQLTTKGQLTAIGNALDDLAERHAASSSAGVVLLSDFGNNTGPIPVGSADSPVHRLGVPVYAVGIGPKMAVELTTELELPRQLKRAERQEIKVTLRQTGLDGRWAKITLSARRNDSGEQRMHTLTQIGAREILLSAPATEERFDFVPSESGEFEFAADVAHIDGEDGEQGNHAQRDATVIDDFLHLMYVEYEPTWEWRFIKEVFHRDPLVGMRGFRTFLRSADPQVRTTNPLFLESLVPARSEFLANDVIFLGDMPTSALNERFCGLVREFVTQFGGGLVVIAGPQFGPGQLAETALADILPVVVDPTAQLRDQRPFRMQLSLESARYPFMQLGDTRGSANASQAAWDNMGELPWYQPVKWAHPLATVLAAHPSDLTADGTAHQPLIAIREFPSGGRVVYLGFDETWRLRRKYGERFYRQFWGQMIQTIGLSSHIGIEKRFVVSTDKREYKPEDHVRLSVQAYDANFEPLTAGQIPGHALEVQLLAPGRPGTSPTEIKSLHASESRKGVFEIEFPVFTPGQYRVAVRDPITKTENENSFRVVDLSPEGLTSVCNTELQEQIARESQGKTYDLQTINRLPDEIDLHAISETSTRVFSLCSSWPCFGFVVALMFGEWLVRKLNNMP